MEQLGPTPTEGSVRLGEGAGELVENWRSVGELFAADGVTAWGAVVSSRTRVGGELPERSRLRLSRSDAFALAASRRDCSHLDA